MYDYDLVYKNKHQFQEPEEAKENERVQIRRERNRIAATKCRNKKKHKLSIILSKAETIEKSNNRLRQEVYQLEAEKRQLVSLLMIKGKGSAQISQKLDPNANLSEYQSSNENNYLFSVIDNLPY